MKLANIAKLATAGIGLSTLAMNSAAFAASGDNINFGTAKVKTSVAGDTASVQNSIPDLINRVSGFLVLLAVIYAVYGGYLYMTAGGNDEQTKQAKTVFKNVAIGLVIIFLAYSIVTSLMTVIFSGTTQE